jgi:hypothetical protein
VCIYNFNKLNELLIIAALWCKVTETNTAAVPIKWKAITLREELHITQKVGANSNKACSGVHVINSSLGVQQKITLVLPLHFQVALITHMCYL